MTSLLAYTPVSSSASPILPQGVYDAIMPFLVVLVLAAFLAPFYAVFLRMGLSVLGELSECKAANPRNFR